MSYAREDLVAAVFYAARNWNDYSIGGCSWVLAKDSKSDFVIEVEYSPISYKVTVYRHVSGLKKPNLETDGWWHASNTCYNRIATTRLGFKQSRKLSEILDAKRTLKEHDENLVRTNENMSKLKELLQEIGGC